MVFYFATDIECKKFYSEEVQLKIQRNVRFVWLSFKRYTRLKFYTKHADLIDPGST